MDMQYTYDCKLKKICEMLLTTLEHNHMTSLNEAFLLNLFIII